MMNELATTRAKTLYDKHCALASDFIVNVIKPLAEMQKQPMEGGAAWEQRFIELVDKFNEYHFRGGRVGDAPIFDFVFDYVNGKIEMLPANMAAQFFLYSIDPIIAKMQAESVVIG